MKKFAFLFLMVGILIGCGREDSLQQSLTNEIVTAPGISIQSGVMGRVIDENDDPVANAMVMLNNQTYTTNEDGLFKIENQKLNKRGTYLQVEKAGYFPGSRRFFPGSAMNNVTVRMLTKEITGTFQSDAGGSISTTDGAKVTFGENVIRDEFGNPYTGEVAVAIKAINPSTLAGQQQMPGDLSGISEEGTEVALGSFGMMAVELNSTTGQPLNILEGETATISMAVPEDLIGNAPAEIPLWSFNEEAGRWIEEGTATLQGNEYVGQVSHFSFWNYDAPFPVVDVNGVIQVEGVPLANAYVCVKMLSSGWTTGGYTSADGSFGGLMPSDELLELQLKNECGEVYFTQQFGPLTADTDLGVIQVPPTTSPSLVTVSGMLENCDGNPVTNGYAKIEWDGKMTYAYAASDGSFETVIDVCDATDFDVTGYDLDNLIASNPSNQAVATTVDVGTIAVCDVVLDEFFIIEFDGTGERIYLEPGAYVGTDSLSGGFINIYLNNNSGGSNDSTYLDFRINADAPGSYTDNEVDLMFYQDYLSSDYNIIECGGSCGFTSLNLTQVGANVGDKIEGNFTGMLTVYNLNQTTVTANVTGSFRVDRDN